MNNPCPVCKSQLSLRTPAPDTRTLTLNCPRCGSYLLTFDALGVLEGHTPYGDVLSDQPLLWAIISHAIRRMQQRGAPPHKVTPAWLQQVWLNEGLPTPQEQADTFVQYLVAANVPSGNWVRCNPQHLTGLLGTADDPTHGETGGFVLVVKGLKNKGLIEEESHPDPRSPGTAGYRLTFEGWERFEELRAEEKKQWITAANALALLAMKHGAAVRTICTRAHAGLIKARAERFIRDGQSADNVDVPAEFWWAKGEAALHQIWETGDFDTWIDRQSVHLQAFGVTFRRSDIERSRTTRVSADEERQKMAAAGKIFIGHGGSPVWRELKDFLVERLHLPVDEFNSVPTAGVPTAERLTEMLDAAAFAFLIMTAEDEQPDGMLRARENVVHEAGLFQGRLGFKKAIILLEQGCEEFSNIHGLGQLRFPKNNIRTIFEGIRQVLERESVIT
jgi:predicted nucleotide-binding protein